MACREPSVQRHLAKVYLTLLVASLITTAGAVVGASLAYGSAYFWLSQLLAFGSMLGLGFTAATPQNLPKRYALLGTFAFCQGVTLSPLVSVAMAVDPRWVLNRSCVNFQSPTGCKPRQWLAVKKMRTIMGWQWGLHLAPPLTLLHLAVHRLSQPLSHPPLTHASVLAALVPTV
jgi:hypothetical protein